MIRKNVLYVIWSLGLGGAEQVVINLARGLDRTRFRVFVACLNDKGVFAASLEKEGVEVIELKKGRGLDLSVLPRLVRLMRNRKVDIVHTHLWGANFWGRIAARMAGVKVVIASEHNVDTWKTIPHKAVDKFLNRWTDRLVAVSGSVMNFYVGNGIPAKKICVIRNGVETSGINGDTLPRQGVPTIAVIGRLVPQKGHKYFLLALRKLIDDFKVKGLIVGSGPLEEELKRFSERLGLNDGVTFTGLRQDVPELLDSVDILVLPSTREGLPLTALEAMAKGIPVVATKVGGTPEVVADGKTGLLVEPENAWALAGAIERLVTDKALSRKLGSNGRIRARNEFGLDRMISEHEELYDECLAEKDLK